MSIQWREEMTVDHGLIDRDHQTLIGIINEFEALPSGGISVARLDQLLDKLGHYAAVHFGREEALQRAARYAFQDAHRHEHRDLIAELAAIRQDLKELQPDAAPNGTPRDLARVHRELSAFLRHWLVDHIIKSDLRMRPYAQAMAGSAAGLAPLAHATDPAGRWHPHGD